MKLKGLINILKYPLFIAVVNMPPSFSIQFTYLDLIDNTIDFKHTLYSNNVVVDLTVMPPESYTLFPPPSTMKPGLPGYEGERCIVDIEIATRLRILQKELSSEGLGLRVFDAYRPQTAVDYLTKWRTSSVEDDPLFKKLHHPSIERIDLQKLSYLAEKSSHSRGVAVDLTLIYLVPPSPSPRPENYLGVWDVQELDVGNVGFLAFDPSSSHDYTDLTKIQQANRKKLKELMWSQGFRKLRSEFWHYFWNMERNTGIYYDFPIRDDYLVREDRTLVIPGSWG